MYKAISPELLPPVLVAPALEATVVEVVWVTVMVRVVWGFELAPAEVRTAEELAATFTFPAKLDAIAAEEAFLVQDFLEVTKVDGAAMERTEEEVMTADSDV